MVSTKFKTLIAVIVIAAISILAGVGINIKINEQVQTDVVVEVPAEATEAEIEYAPEQVPAVIEGDQGEVVETIEIDGEEIPTVEEVDGGLFEDYQSVTHDLTTDVYYDIGAIESVDTSTPEAFKNSTLRRCIIANNYYGAQCVSLARAFWWSYANRDVSTCGTGAAKGMMNCAAENAGDDFIVYGAEDKPQIQAGDWLVFSGGLYGHVGMALGPVVNGYVALLGENQGGASCGAGVGGSATNIINISVKNLIGFYRPKAYVKVEPTPEPTPGPTTDVCKVREVRKGDTLGAIMQECEGKIEWGAAMDEYARHWYSVKLEKYLTVFDGWASQNGVGLFAGDTIEYRTN